MKKHQNLNKFSTLHTSLWNWMLRNQFSRSSRYFQIGSTQLTELYQFCRKKIQGCHFHFLREILKIKLNFFIFNTVSQKMIFLYWIHWCATYSDLHFFQLQEIQQWLKHSSALSNRNSHIKQKMLHAARTFRIFRWKKMMSTLHSTIYSREK